jgi:phosphoglycerate dehydrogenase-like enzyme
MRTKPLVLFDPFPRPRARIFNAEQWARLAAMATVVETGDGQMADDIVERWLPEASVVIGQTALGQERIAQALQLKSVINVEGNFFQNVAYESCFARGISVLSIAPAFATPVAEMCLTLALDLARGVTAGDQAMRLGSEVYGTAGNQDAVLLTGARVGIIGYGNIGRVLRRMLAGFRAQVSVYDPWLPANAIHEDDARPVGLDELLRTSQFIIVLASVTSDNRGFLDRAKLELIAEGSIFVLASRAGVVDFDALVELANAGRFRAATDVFPLEPVPRQHRVRQSRLLLSAHRAGGTPATALAIGEMVLDDLSLILQGLPPVRLQAARRETVSRMRSPPARSLPAPTNATSTDRVTN